MNSMLKKAFDRLRLRSRMSSCAQGGPEGETGRLGPEMWDMSCGPEGHLLSQGCDLVDLARKYGTPLYVVDLGRLEKNYHTFLSSFQSLYPDVAIAYSYKTNPLPGVLKRLHGLGASAEVVSHFELWLALKLGVSPERIIYNGPAKTEESLRDAISKRVNMINVNEFEEMDLIDGLAATQDHRQQVGLRVVSSKGWSSKFGLPIAGGAAFEGYSRLRKLRNVDPCGIHLHLGSGIRNVEKYLIAIREVLEFSKGLAKELGIRLRYFDFGGGFSVPTVRLYSKFDRDLLAKGIPSSVPDVTTCPSLSEYGEKIVSLFSEYYPVHGEGRPTICFEPGRAITSSAQTLLLKVLAVKPAKNGFVDVIMDGGTNVAMPPTYEYHEVFAASKMNSPCTVTCRLHGPLCHPTDLVFKAKRLTSLAPGDILAIMDAGAYFVPNQQNFSFPRPAAVLMEEGRSGLIRTRESFENMVALDRF